VVTKRAANPPLPPGQDKQSGRIGRQQGRRATLSNADKPLFVLATGNVWRTERDRRANAARYPGGQDRPAEKSTRSRKSAWPSKIRLTSLTYLHKTYRCYIHCVTCRFLELRAILRKDSSGLPVTSFPRWMIAAKRNQLRTVRSNRDRQIVMILAVRIANHSVMLYQKQAFLLCFFSHRCLAA
jgi:hypothetical protein